jgi:transposase
VQRALIILSLAEGDTLATISRERECSVNTVKLWHRRFLKDRIPGLEGRHKGKTVEKGTKQLEARILNWTLHRKPQNGSAQWSSRKLATALGISHMRVARTWTKAGVSLSR